MEILKEFRQRIGRENIIITLWDNESIDIEYGGVTMSFKSLWQLEGFLELLENDIEIMKEKTASNMEKKDWKKKLRELSFMKGYYFKLDDNGLVEKKDDQLVFRREELEYFISQELDKAREEGKLEYILSLGWQDTNNEYVKEVLEDADRIAKLLEEENEEKN